MKEEMRGQGRNSHFVLQPAAARKGCFRGVRLAAAGWTDKGRVRPTNEDAFFVGVDGNGYGPAVCIVADGMGGCNAGEVASKLTVETVAAGVGEWLATATEEADGSPGLALVEDAPEALATAVLAANRKVYELGKLEPSYTGMGTTVTAALLAADHVSLAHVGDSRAFRIRGGAAEQITIDHSVVAELMRNGALTEAEAESHPHRNVLTRALGTDPVLAVDLWQEKLVPGDIILLCSDGVTRHLDRTDLARLAGSGMEPGKAAKAIVDLANSRGGSDNLTAVVIIAGCSG